MCVCLNEEKLNCFRKLRHTQMKTGCCLWKHQLRPRQTSTKFSSLSVSSRVVLQYGYFPPFSYCLSSAIECFELSGCCRQVLVLTSVLYLPNCLSVLGPCPPNRWCFVTSYISSISTNVSCIHVSLSCSLAQPRSCPRARLPGLVAQPRAAGTCHCRMARRPRVEGVAARLSVSYGS